MILGIVCLKPSAILFNYRLPRILIPHILLMVDWKLCQVLKSYFSSTLECKPLNQFS